MSSFTLYVLLTLDSIAGLLLLFCVLSGAASAYLFILYMMAFIENKDLRKKILRELKYAISIFIIAVLLKTFVPTTKQALIIWGVPTIVNNEQIQDIGKDSLLLLQKKIEEELNNIEEPSLEDLKEK